MCVRKCIIKEGQVRYLDDDDPTLFEDGTHVSAEQAEDVMVEFPRMRMDWQYVRKFRRRRIQKKYRKSMRFALTLADAPPTPGYKIGKIHPAFKVGKALI